MTSGKRSEVARENRQWIERILAQIREQIYDALEKPNYYGHIEITALVQNSQVIGFDTAARQTVRDRGIAKPKQ
jgi:hypothetical protein